MPFPFFKRPNTVRIVWELAAFIRTPFVLNVMELEKSNNVHVCSTVDVGDNDDR